ncbi:DUF3304 domain-containing protein [Burkholderia stagnalis]|uniref:DUF3304 domain-containing protein n=1 Tax=Burkholderia stagnalis TaxID=1503054 RepID=UPI002AB51682|nr:DUF3304 domain-containing protein [Burkholderia stagnalis]MDY7801530.1 DUF3304 domain-containing protein [Burkholderia stagnalis]
MGESMQSATSGGRLSARISSARARFRGWMMVVLMLVGLPGCSDSREVNPAGIYGYNYTSAYIHMFRISSEDGNVKGVGPNISPKRLDQERSGGGAETCCVGIPKHWRPGMKLAVQWYANKMLDGKLGTWYVAHTEVPRYGPSTYGFWVHFLPDDRVRIQVLDNPYGPARPADDDPYIVQGVPDKEENWDQKIAFGGWAKQPVAADAFEVGMSGQNFSENRIFFGVNGTGQTASIGRAVKDGAPLKSKENCCAQLSPKWKPGSKVSLLWRRDSARLGYNDDNEIAWVEAEAPLPKYAEFEESEMDGREPRRRVWRKLWVQFFPGDRVRVVLGNDDLPTRPQDDDPDIVRGTVLDRMEVKAKIEAGT